MIVKDTGDGHAPDENESEQPDWTSLSEVFQQTDPLFRNTLFLEGYDFSSNIYIFIGEYITVVDPGNDYTAFMQLFERPQFAPGDIRKIVLTHGHPDHAMGTMELFRYQSIKQNPELEVIIHQSGPRELKEIIRQFGVRLTELTGGETLDLSGFRWEVIHTPGHTQDGICLYHAPTLSLLSGDMALPGAMAVPDRQAGGSLDLYRASMRKLLQREIKNILPGHGPPIAGLGRKIVEKSYITAINTSLGIDLNKSLPWFETASAAASREMREEAVFCCDRALEETPRDFRPLKLKALCLNDLGHFQEALDSFLLLEQYSPPEKTDTFTMLGKGLAFLGLAQYEDSLLCFEEVLQTTGNKDARIYKALALYLSGNVDAAMEIEEFASGLVQGVVAELIKAFESRKKTTTD